MVGIDIYILYQKIVNKYIDNLAIIYICNNEKQSPLLTESYVAFKSINKWWVSAFRYIFQKFIDIFPLNYIFAKLLQNDRKHINNLSKI